MPRKSSDELMKKINYRPKQAETELQKDTLTKQQKQKKPGENTTEETTK